MKHAIFCAAAPVAPHPAAAVRRTALIPEETTTMAVRTAPERVAARSEQAERTVHPHSAPLAGFSGTRRVPEPVNEPVKSYAPGSPERAALKARLAEMANERVDIPIPPALPLASGCTGSRAAR